MSDSTVESPTIQSNKPVTKIKDHSMMKLWKESKVISKYCFDCCSTSTFRLGLSRIHVVRSISQSIGSRNEKFELGADVSGEKKLLFFFLLNIFVFSSKDIGKIDQFIKSTRIDD